MATLKYGISIEELKRLGYKPTKLNVLVDEFIESGEDAAELKIAEGEYSSTNCCVSSILANLKKRHITSVKVTQKNGRVFLVRKEN